MELSDPAILQTFTDVFTYIRDRYGSRPFPVIHSVDSYRAHVLGRAVTRHCDTRQAGGPGPCPAAAMLQPGRQANTGGNPFRESQMLRRNTLSDGRPRLAGSGASRPSVPAEWTARAEAPGWHDLATVREQRTGQRGRSGGPCGESGRKGIQATPGHLGRGVRWPSLPIYAVNTRGSSQDPHLHTETPFSGISQRSPDLGSQAPGMWLTHSAGF